MIHSPRQGGVAWYRIASRYSGWFKNLKLMNCFFPGIFHIIFFSLWLTVTETLESKAPDKQRTTISKISCHCSLLTWETFPYEGISSVLPIMLRSLQKQGASQESGQFIDWLIDWFFFYIAAARDPSTPFLLLKAESGCGLAMEGVVSMGSARQGKINTVTCGFDDSSATRDHHTSLESPCLCRKYL